MAKRGARDAESGTARTYNPEQTLDRLVEAGVELFGSQGFHATSVREIVDAAGLTKGAFYHHFESKEDLLHLIHDEFIDFHLAGQRVILAEVQTPHERLFHLVRLLALGVARYTSQVAVYFQEYRALPGDDFPDVHAKRTEGRNAFVQVITDGVASGDFRADVDPRMAAMGVLGMGNWIYQWYSDATPWSAEEIARSFGLMALRSLTAKPRVVAALANRKLDAEHDPVRGLLKQARPEMRRPSARLLEPT
jgi:AcrR family transcriptional regulator